MNAQRLPQRLTALLHNPLGRTVLALGLVATLAVGVVGVVRVAHAASTWTVCLAGAPTCDFGSINDALASASVLTGDTISLDAETFSPANETHATTTDTQITFTKGVILKGAGAGSTTIAQPMSATGNIIVNPSGTGGTELTGFTIEGNGTNGNCSTTAVRPLLIVNKDSHSIDTVEVDNVTFFEDSTTDCVQPDDFSIGFYNSGSPANTDIASNSFDGLWQAVFSENANGALNVTTNIISNLQANTDVAHGCGTAQMPEAIFDFAHSSTTVTKNQFFSGNVFQNFPAGGLGIGIFGGFNSSGKMCGAMGADAGAGTMDNVAIESNQFNYSAPGIGGMNNVFDKPYDILVEADDTNSHVSGLLVQGNLFNVQGSMGGIGFNEFNATTATGGAIDNSASANSVNHNSVNITAPTSSVVDNTYGMALNGDFSSTSFTQNYVFGDTVPSSGMDFGIFIQTGSSPTATFTINDIERFSTGVSIAGPNPGGISFDGVDQAHGNCIQNNGGGMDSLFGSLDAQHNWWGASDGPAPGGSGNSALGVDASNFLTQTADVCTYPTVSLTHGAPSYTNGGTTYVTGATVFTVSGSIPAGSSLTVAVVAYRFCPTSCTFTDLYTFGPDNSTFSLSGADGPYEIDYFAISSGSTFSGVQTANYTLDNTAPTASITTPANGQTYTQGGTLTINFSTSDSGAGIDSSATSATLDSTSVSNGQTITLSSHAMLDSSNVLNGQRIDLSQLSLGSHTLTVTAKDNVGNTTTVRSTFTVSPVGLSGAASGAQPVNPQGPTGGPVASNPGSGANNGASGTNSGANGSNGTASSATSGSQGSSGTGFPVALFVLLVILLGAAGASLFVVRQRGILDRFLSR